MSEMRTVFFLGPFECAILSKIFNFLTCIGTYITMLFVNTNLIYKSVFKWHKALKLYYIKPWKCSVNIASWPVFPLSFQIQKMIWYQDLQIVQNMSSQNSLDEPRMKTNDCKIFDKRMAGVKTFFLPFCCG